MENYFASSSSCIFPHLSYLIIVRYLSLHRYWQFFEVCTVVSRWFASWMLVFVRLRSQQLSHGDLHFATIGLQSDVNSISLSLTGCCRQQYAATHQLLVLMLKFSPTVNLYFSRKISLMPCKMNKSNICVVLSRIHFDAQVRIRYEKWLTW